MTGFIGPWPAATSLAWVQAGFIAQFGQPPAAVHSAPGRVNLVGEHTDYNQGLCPPIALPQRSFVAYSPARDDAASLASSDTPPW